MPAAFHNQSNVVLSSKIDPSFNVFCLGGIDDIDWVSDATAWSRGIRETSIIIPILKVHTYWIVCMKCTIQPCRSNVVASGVVESPLVRMADRGWRRWCKQTAGNGFVELLPLCIRWP